MKKSKNGKKAGDTPIFAIFASAAGVANVDRTALASATNAYSCGACHQKWAMNPLVAKVEASDGADTSVDPFCPHCGSAESELITDPQEKIEDLSKQETLASLQCSCCKTTLVMSAAAASNDGFSEVIACPVCDTVTTFASEDDPGELEGEAQDGTNREEIEAGDDEDAEDEESEDEDDDTTEASDDEEEDEEEEDETTEAADDAEELEGEAQDGTTRDELPVLSFAAQDAAIGFYRVKDKVFASVGDLTVAVQAKADLVESRHELFDSPRYMQALASSVKSLGLEQTIEDFGMRKLTIAGLSKETANAMSDERIQTTASAMAVQKTEAMAGELRSCLAIASVAMGKGFYGKKHVNGLKKALASAMKSTGMRNPERELDRAFATASDDYHSDLLELAFDLMSQPLDARNAIASAVEDMAYPSGLRVESSDDDEEEEGDMDELEDADSVTVESSLARPFTAERHVTASVDIGTRRGNTKGSARATVASVLESNGGRLF